MKWNKINSSKMRRRRMRMRMMAKNQGQLARERC
jgi:hypothetical protein